jgi:hypothetical protein
VRQVVSDVPVDDEAPLVTSGRQVVSDFPVDDEAPLVTSGISRSVGAQSFGGAHRDSKW